MNANYTEQKIPRFRKNKLIEALPPSLDDDALLQSLVYEPEFSIEQRQWEAHERVQMIFGLTNFQVPLARHIELARTIDALMREGYVGREPRTAEHTRVYQKIYDSQITSQPHAGHNNLSVAQFSCSLIGPSGMGKTTSIKRMLSRIPRVIFHSDLQLWQIPYLHIEMPHDGASIKGLAHSILRQVDKLIPDCHYYEMYAMRGNPSVETLMNNVALVLHNHCVGILICDEIQNLGNAPKNKQGLMTLLVSASNELQVPIIFVGTNKARKILGLDFRQARRSSGYGLDTWLPLQKGTLDQPEEWEGFLSVLFEKQWVKHPVQLNDYLSNLIFHHSQGIIDIAIKLFAACQLRAIYDGTETITAQLIDAVWKASFQLVHPMIEALRSNNRSALEAFDDIAPLNLENISRDLGNQLYGKQLRATSIRPGNDMFIPTLSATLETIGIDQGKADSIAEQIAQEGTALDLFEGTKQAIAKLKPLKQVNSAKAKSNQLNVVYEPQDMRNAIQAAHQEQTSIMQQLELRRMLPSLDTILPLA